MRCVLAYRLEHFFLAKHELGRKLGGLPLEPRVHRVNDGRIEIFERPVVLFQDSGKFCVIPGFSVDAMSSLIFFDSPPSTLRAALPSLAAEALLFTMSSTNESMSTTSSLA